MGQYFKAVLVDNEWFVKVVEPDGWKLMEHSYYWSRTMKRIEKILYRNAYNVYWVGDYSRLAPLVWKHKFENEEEISYTKELTKDEVLDIEADTDNNYYLVNQSSREFIDMSKQCRDENLQDWYKRVVHPLPLLCRNETEEAWWWYHSDIGREHIWKWEWDIISIYSWKEDVAMELVNKWFKDMTDIYFFKE